MQKVLILSLTFKLIDAHILKSKTAPQGFKIETVGFFAAPHLIPKSHLPQK